MISKHLGGLWGYRELLWQLTVRELKVRYKQTFLGVLWAVLQPFSLMLIFTFVFSYCLKVSTPGLVPYPLFTYTGLLPWTFFSSSLLLAIPSLTGNANLVSKIYFPRELLPISAILAALMDFFIAGLIFWGLLIYYHHGPSWNWLLAFPIFILQIIFTMGVSLFFAALNVKYRDIRYLVPLLLQLWMFASPVFYSAELVPKGFYSFYMLNPMAFFIEAYHQVMLAGVSPFSLYFYVAAGVTGVVFFLAYRYFKRSERWFAEVI